MTSTTKVKLWLLRHGEAEPADGRITDGERRLTAYGEREAEQAGAALSRLGVTLSACHTSPRVRAHETARRACAAAGLQPQVAAALSAGFDSEDLSELLLAHAPGDDVLVVGHQPDLSQLVHDLTGAPVAFATGGLACVKFAGRAGELVVLLRPRDLRALAGVAGAGT